MATLLDVPLDILEDISRTAGIGAFGSLISTCKFLRKHLDTEAVWERLFTATSDHSFCRAQERDITWKKTFRNLCLMRDFEQYRLFVSGRRKAGRPYIAGLNSRVRRIFSVFEKPSYRGLYMDTIGSYLDEVAAKCRGLRYYTPQRIDMLQEIFFEFVCGESSYAVGDLAQCFKEGKTFRSYIAQRLAQFDGTESVSLAPSLSPEKKAAESTWMIDFSGQDEAQKKPKIRPQPLQRRTATVLHSEIPDVKPLTRTVSAKIDTGAKAVRPKSASVTPSGSDVSSDGLKPLAAARKPLVSTSRISSVRVTTENTTPRRPSSAKPVLSSAAPKMTVKSSGTYSGATKAPSATKRPSVLVRKPLTSVQQ